ncbi:MAG: radical SAM protein [Candidatus Eisenbacteria bacterium]|nr:radical SAM protein [Candidatus Eisenbacteria bacterium]
MRLSAEQIRDRAALLARRMGACDLCPRRCGVDRTRGERGFCGSGARAELAVAVAHFGEEPPISGRRGAGTLFFAGCNLRCVYCQNHQISRLTIPVPEIDTQALAEEMLRLQRLGCHNIELVTPTHVLPAILEAWARAREQGCDLPLVYNCGGYESLDLLRLLEGIVDLYLPDLKYADPGAAEALSVAPDYWDVARAAVREMLRQVGALSVDAHGIARRGVIVRHLILPNDLADSGRVLAFLADCDPRPSISLMGQFYPTGDCRHPLLQRGLSEGEYARACAQLEALGIAAGWVQARSAEADYRPDFRRADPFDCGPNVVTRRLVRESS